MHGPQTTIEALLDRHEQTFAEELGLDIPSNTPAPLFRLLCFSLLASARIRHEVAVQATRALAEAGWTTPAHLQDSSWRERTNVLNKAGYARYDESTSRMLADTVEHLIEDYRGDLRRLRADADGNVDKLKQRLKTFKGIGDVGADVFLREVQVAWDEVYPYMDSRARRMAADNGLPDAADELAARVDNPQMFVRLVDGLVRDSFTN